MLEKEQLLLLAKQLVGSLSLHERIFISRASAASVSKAFKIPEDMTVVELLKLGAEGTKDEPSQAVERKTTWPSYGWSDIMEPGIQASVQRRHWPSYGWSDIMEPGIQASVQRRHRLPAVDTLGILQRTMKERAPLGLPPLSYGLNALGAEPTIGTLSDAEILLQEVPGGAEQVATPPNQAARNSYLRGRTDRKLSRIVRLLQVINPLIPLEQLELELSTFSSYPFVSTDRILGLAELFKARHHREFLVDRARKVSQNFIEQGVIEYVVGVAKVPAGGEVEIRLLASEHHLAVHCPDFPAQTRYFRTFSGARSFFYRLCKDLRRGSLQSGHAIIHGNLTPF